MRPLTAVEKSDASEQGHLFPLRNADICGKPVEWNADLHHCKQWKVDILPIAKEFQESASDKISSKESKEWTAHPCVKLITPKFVSKATNPIEFTSFGYRYYQFLPTPYWFSALGFAAAGLSTAFTPQLLDTETCFFSFVCSLSILSSVEVNCSLLLQVSFIQCR